MRAAGRVQTSQCSRASQECRTSSRSRSTPEHQRAVMDMRTRTHTHARARVLRHHMMSVRVRLPNPAAVVAGLQLSPYHVASRRDSACHHQPGLEHQTVLV
eukprot:XP_001693342.1 predicted protein [Chlamydomonas reinhardtii]